ncbi:hypothetical protein C0J52_20099 [Blattella germanica]|nr:hypothetical protein C0J52_20099 [Blattella germanica]
MANFMLPQFIPFQINPPATFKVFLNKEDQLDDILAKKEIRIAAITETKKKLKESKETNNYIQFYSGVPRDTRAQAGVMVMIHYQIQKFIKLWPDQFLLMAVRLGAVKKNDEKRLTAAEMRSMRRTAGCSLLEHRRNAEVLAELKIDPNTEYIASFQGEKNHRHRQIQTWTFCMGNHSALTQSYPITHTELDSFQGTRIFSYIPQTSSIIFNTDRENMWISLRTSITSWLLLKQYLDFLDKPSRSILQKEIIAEFNFGQSTMASRTN